VSIDPTTDQLSIDALRAAVDGNVIAPDDPGYDEARATLYGGDLRPAAIVRAANAADVAEVVRLAAATGLELAVRSGGHSGVAHCTTDGGIQLDLVAMKDIDIDVAARTVWAETGLTAGEVTTAVGEHGLVIGFGDTGSVGIGGITTGGGVGYLVRKYGLAIDNVIAAEVVTADGELVRADSDQHPDLFWAIRGGGGNFGVVTRFQYRLEALPGIVGGLLILPATADTVAAAIAAAEAAPDELSAILNVMTCPPMPFVAEEHHGQLVILAMITYAGDAEAGALALAPFRAVASPLADLLQAMPYADLFQPEPEGGPHLFAAGRTLFLDHVDHAVADRIVGELEAHVRTSGAVMAVSQLRVLGGAFARVPSGATAFAHRSSRIMVNLASLVAVSDDLPAHVAWVRSFAEGLQQGDTGAYVNFVSEDGPEGVRAAYPGPTWDRLVDVKNRYDPTNLFRRNHNIPPTGPVPA
jgi:FAD/FMN-containing dehydrogenase